MDHVTIDYNADGTRTVTNPLGKQTTYSFQTIAGKPKLMDINLTALRRGYEIGTGKAAAEVPVEEEA